MQLMTSQLNSKSVMHFQKGFTLIEILVSIAMMSVLTTVALTMMGSVVDDARFSQTTREIEQIRNAMVGETQRLETGLRKNYGYLGDVGALPTTSQGLSVLLSEGAATAAGLSMWSINASYGIGSGWKGPYLTNTDDQDYTRDAWGNAYVYTNTGGTNATITSYGADGVSGGTGFNQDIVVSIPTDVVRGRLLGYVVAAQGDVTGADQVPFSGNARIELRYANGSGGIAMQSQTISAANSGRYSFSNVPLGIGALMVFISTSPTQVIGPSIVELNKAATAAVPLARDASTIYGTVSACPISENYSITSMSVNNASRLTQFRISLPSAYAWSGPFHHEHQSNAAISRFVITQVGTSSTRTYYSASTGIKLSSTGAAFAAGTTHVMSSVQILSAGQHDFTFYYNSSGWVSSTSSFLPVFYYQLGCKFFGLRPE